MTQPIDEATLDAFMDGQLTAEEAARIEAQAAGDAALAIRIRAGRALRDAVRGAYADVVAEAVPERLLAAVGASRKVSDPGIVDLAQARAERTSRWAPSSGLRWGALAASLTAAFVIGRVLGPLPPTGAVVSGPAGLMARGVLAKGLEGQLASNQPPEAPVKIGVSFQAADGDYCRTFSLRGRQALAGLACREPAGWRVRLAVQAPPLAPEGGYRTAAAETPPLVLEAVDQTIRGAPLDAAAEARARAAHWLRGRAG